MTLQRQLLITIIILFSLMFLGTLGITTKIDENYIDNQMRIHARDAATSLGLILSQETNQNNLGTMTAIIDAVYDRGYYQQITLSDINNQTLVSRKSNLKIADVPIWFVDFVNFKTPTEEALVMSGWKNFGKVSVASHPGYAYKDLWQNTYFTFIYYLIISILLLFAGVLAIHGLLRPLQAIARQAIAIGNGEFPLLDYIPKTLQLREVALTMNTMVKKLERRFEEYRHVTTELRKRVYQDPVTDLYNQTYFFNHIQHEITNASIQQSALIVQIELQGLAQYNLEHGALMGDALLKKFTDFLLQFTQSTPSQTVARLIGARFGLVVLPIDLDAIALWVQKLEKECRQFAMLESTEKVPLAIYLGAEIGKTGMTAVELIAASDIALSIARGDVTHYNIQSLESGEIHAEILWSDILKDILENKSIRISMQPCFSTDHAILYQEIVVTATLQDGHEVEGKILQVMAERFGVDTQLQKMVIDDALLFLEGNQNIISRFVIPISGNVLQSDEFKQWLESSLKQYRFANKIVLEISEFNFITLENQILEFVQRILPLGVQFAFRHYGKSKSDLTYLKRLKIMYLKIDPSFTNQIQENEDNQLFVEVLIRMAHCIDIKVTAYEVLSQAEADMLISLDIDALHYETSDNK